MLAVSCKENGPEQPENKTLSILATVDGTLVKEWKASDEIKVVVADEMYTFTTSGSGRSATFTEPEGLLTAAKVGTNPVSAYYGCSSMFGTFRISSEPQWEGGAVKGTIPMYAYTMNAPENNTLALSFKSLASILSFDFQAFDMKVDKISITPADNATISFGALAGGFTADAAQGNVSVTNAVNSIVVEFPSKLDLSKGAKVDIPVGWFTVAGGLKVVLTYDSVKEYESIIWADGSSVSSFDNASGLRSGAIKTVSFEFDANAFPRDYYVKADAPASGKGLSWAAPATLSYALEAAKPESRIHMAAGTYKVDGNITMGETSLKGLLVDRNIALIGGYPANASAGATANPSANPTIIDGGETAAHVLVVAAPKVEGMKVTLSGLTIKGGKSTAGDAVLNFGELSLYQDYAAGLALMGSVVDMENCVVTGNDGVNAAGLYCTGSSVNIKGGEISGNTSSGNGAGAWFAAGTDLVMDGTVIKENEAGAIVGGLYLYTAAEKTLKAVIRNVTFLSNKATTNAGGLYVRDDSGSFGLDASFENCLVEKNSGSMGAAILILNARPSFKGCSIVDNIAAGNGMVYVQTSGTGSDEVLFDGCLFKGNTSSGSAVGSAIYAYNNSSSGTIRLDVLNSAFVDNTSGGRAAVYLRNNQAGTVTGNFVNCTMTGNSAGSWGGAIDLYGAAAKPVVLNLYSCTVVDNVSTKDTAPGGIVLETAGTSVNTWNSIIAGNTTVGVENNVNPYKSNAVAHRATIVGGDYFKADRTAGSVSPAFNTASMLAAPDSYGVRKLVGNSSNNPAFGNGLTATALKALASGSISAEVLGADQRGLSRNDTDKIMGASVAK